MLKRILKTEIGGWSEMEYDAQMKRLGITWYRVKGGMGGRGDREDWIANLPSGCVVVHGYQYRAPYWGFEKYRSLNAAIAGQIEGAIKNERGKISACESKIKAARESLQLLQAALSKSI